MNISRDLKQKNCWIVLAALVFAGLFLSIIATESIQGWLALVLGAAILISILVLCLRVWKRNKTKETHNEKQTAPVEWQYRHFSMQSYWCLFLLIAVVIMMVLFFIRISDTGKPQIISFTVNSLLLLASSIVNLVTSIAMQGMKIDAEAKTVVWTNNRKKVIDGTKLRNVVRHIGWKGRLKYVTVWFEGYGYHDIRMNDDEYLGFIEKAKLLNPDLVVKEYS